MDVNCQSSALRLADRVQDFCEVLKLIGFLDDAGEFFPEETPRDLLFIEAA